MAGGNFDPTLYVSPTTKFVEWPKGPLKKASGETILRVEAWVLQKYSGAIQMTFQTSGFDTFWEANQVWFPNTPNPWTGGLFVKNKPALGIAVVIARKGGVQSYFWWAEEVELV